MDFKPHVSFTLTDRSFQNIVKRDIAKLAEGLGFKESEVGKINLIISEMASNLIKHEAVNGEILVKPIGEKASGLEIICIDQGPGMSDPQRMLEDGVSTVGTHGEGLGAIKRISDEFDLYSSRGVGTVVLSRIYKSRQKPKAGKIKRFDIGVVMVPKTGETDCGDGWAMYESINTCYLLVADGLGHGEFAQQASQGAVETFLQQTNQTPSSLIRSLHASIKRTRGAVANVALIDLKDQTLTYCGIGNIAGRFFSGADGTKSIISYNGILGHNIPNTINNHQIPWSNQGLLVVHSDGLKSKWDLARYKDLQRHDTSVIAALLYKDFKRGTDDTLVLVGRTRG
ncbi:ATP-binding SpoIIE family protein phosphatase [Adhaeribacter aquaticus]|uniref:ATP-binding SpoIIE family protein phosphatase n=1 Tax=Adhaeribacter aquaticus TaxID=299567 RepID=UPI0003FB70D1|nr:ATP-binding SpoIIE family protein phosphatase [Adhaeribacter aquaticus]